MRRPRLPPLPVLVVLGLLLAGYAGVLATRSAFVASGTDSSGYLHFARMIAAFDLDRPLPFPSDLEIDPGFREAVRPEGFALRAGHDTISPRYPMGLPIHQALGIWIAGDDDGAFLAAPIIALAGLLLMYALARSFGLEPGWAAAGSVALALCPAYLFQALQPMSDVLAAVWIMAAIAAALASHRDRRWAIVAGIAFAMAVLTRPTNALLIFAVALALPWKRDTLLRFVLAGVPFALLLAAWNTYLSGSPLETGYGDTAAQAKRFFHPAFFPERARKYGHWLSLFLSPLIPLAWLGIAFLRSVPARRRAVLVMAFLPLLVFYGCYRLCEDWTYTRFLLPGVPALIVSGLLVARAVTGRLLVAGDGPPWRRALAIALLAGAGLWVAGTALRWDHKLRILKFHEDKELYRSAVAWVDETLPEKVILASHEMSGAITYYTDRPILNWRQMAKRDPRFSELRARAERQGYRFYALLHDREALELGPWLEGRWDLLGTHGAWITLWKLRPLPPAPDAPPPPA